MNMRVLDNLKIKERLIIAATMLFMAGYLMDSLIILPALYHYKIVGRQFYVQQQLIESRQRKTEELRRFKNNFEDVKRKSVEKKKVFFTDAQALDFLNNLDIWTKETGNQLENISPKAMEKILDSQYAGDLCYKNNLVEITLKGGYNDLLRLFNRFADYEKLLGVSRIDLHPAEEAPALLDIRFCLNIYMLCAK